MKISWRTLLVFSLFLALAFPGQAADLPLETWLTARVRTFNPVLDNRPLELENTLSFDPVNLWPAEGSPFAWSPDQIVSWTPIKALDGLFPTGEDALSSLLLAATYLAVPRWQPAVLHVNSAAPFKVYLDGKALDGQNRIPLVLSQGKHRLLVAALDFPDRTGGLRISLELEEKFKNDWPAASLDPKHPLSLEDIIAFQQPALSFFEPGINTALSPDGTMVSIINLQGGLDIIRVADGKLMRSFAIAKPFLAFSWSPSWERLAAVIGASSDGQEIWVFDRATGSGRPEFKNLNGVTQITWHPDGKHLIFTTTDVPPPNRDYDLVDSFFDRWPPWRNKISLWLGSLENGNRHVIHSGASPFRDSGRSEVSPNGRQAAFIRSTPTTEFPYEHQELWIVDLLSGQSRKVMDLRVSQVGEIAWSPDSKRLVLVAPHYDFPITPADPVHSRWNFGLMLVDLAGGAVRNLLPPTFTPHVESLWWHPEGELFFVALDRTVHRLYALDKSLNRLREITLPFKNVEGFLGCLRGDWAVLKLGEIDRPSWLEAYNLRTGAHHVLWDPAGKRFSQLTLGRTELFSSQNRRGDTIDGWIYFPPDFDPNKKYPMIVYYYGGVVPQSQTFLTGNGGVLNHWFAANGYIAFTLTPRGTWGYGQDWADAHINEWGEASANDIIDVVQALLREKPYIDPKKIGGFGHSYGGFEGLSLATRTDLFSALIASGVISNPLLYSFVVLGQPNYGEIVLPGIYPWNRKDIYVDRAPVFNADKIQTPILLVQGNADPWCTLAESDLMYSALRVQGKEAVQIRWLGEGHGIGDPRKKTINYEIWREWFDKWLKDNGEAWAHRVRKDTP